MTKRAVVMKRVQCIQPYTAADLAVYAVIVEHMAEYVQSLDSVLKNAQSSENEASSWLLRKLSSHLQRRRDYLFKEKERLKIGRAHV